MSHQMQVLDPTGHTSITWDKRSPEQVETARTVFNDMVKKGYRAFRPGESGGQIDAFDAEAERIVIVPHLVGG